MFILQALVFFFIQAVFAQEPTPILPQRLTKVIVGRTIKVATSEPTSVFVLFDDQSSMKIKTAGPATIPQGCKIKSVHEVKAEFKIEFEDGSSATLNLADPGSSVAVRDENNAVEYLG